MGIAFVPLYPDAASADTIIANVISLLSDEQYQVEALAWANGGEPLEPYVLVSESAVWRETKQMPSPLLLLKDVTLETDDDRPRLKSVLRFSLYHFLAEGDHEVLMREAYRRNHAGFMMLISAPRTALFAGTNVDNYDVQVTRKNPSDTIPGQALYLRLPSMDVEIRFEESP